MRESGLGFRSRAGGTAREAVGSEGSVKAVMARSCGRCGGGKAGGARLCPACARLRFERGGRWLNLGTAAWEIGRP